MNRGSPVSGSSPDVRVGSEAVAGEQVADQPAQSRRPSLPAFPGERAERAVQTVSRIAGPVAFVLALGGVIWLVAR